MKLYSITSFIVVLFGLSFLHNSTEQKITTESTTISSDKGEWTTIEKAIIASKKDNKKILIDVYTDWCKWCKVMDEKTFKDQSTISFLQENFHLVKFNAETRTDVTFGDETYKYSSQNKRGYHELALEMLDGKLSYPSLVVYDSNLKKLQIINGFKTADQLMVLLSDHNS